ncbi:hypothetical protein [Ursidibacter arcticus]
MNKIITYPQIIFYDHLSLNRSQLNDSFIISYPQGDFGVIQRKVAKAKSNLTAYVFNNGPSSSKTTFLPQKPKTAI